jgi:hypothetical protein
MRPILKKLRKRLVHKNHQIFLFFSPINDSHDNEVTIIKEGEHEIRDISQIQEVVNEHYQAQEENEVQESNEEIDEGVPL